MMERFNSSPFLNLDELNQIEESNPQTRLHQTFLYVLQQCHEKIREYNSNKKSKSCHYKPPIFIPGKSLYNYYELIQFLINQLQQNGLYTQYNAEEGIFICWDPRIINQQKYRQQLSEKIILPEDLPKSIQHTKEVAKPKSKAGAPVKITKKPVSKAVEPEKVVNLIQIGNDEFPINY